MAGDLGPAPPGAELSCLAIANDRPAQRQEIASAGVPLGRDLDPGDLSRLAVVGPGERLVAAQFDVLSRWGTTVVGELARDNLRAGILCEGPVDPGPGLDGDIPGPPAAPPTDRFTPQQFMQNALRHQFFWRYWGMYGDPPTGSVRRGLVESARVLYSQGLAQLPGGALDVGGDWAPASTASLPATAPPSSPVSPTWSTARPPCTATTSHTPARCSCSPTSSTRRTASANGCARPTTTPSWSTASTTSATSTPPAGGRGPHR